MNRLPRSAVTAVALVAFVSIVTIVTIAAIAAPTATARPTSAYRAVLRAYEKSGRVPPCAFSSQQLSTALKGVDAYEAQYFQDFTDAINQALTARAAGACDRTAPASGGNSTSAGAVPTGSLPGPVDPGVPAPILLLAVLGGVLGLAVAFAGIWRRRGWDPGWAAALRHSWSEAGYRAEGTWEELLDWWRSAPRSR